MKRRTFVALTGTGVLSTAGGVGAFKPSVLVGSPRGGGESVSITRLIGDDAITYRSDTDTVRYPTRVGADGPAGYETEPFERWAKRRCASVGSEAVLPALRDRFEAELTGVSTGVESEYVGPVIAVSATTTRDRDGEVVSEPTVDFESLVEKTPGTVEATVKLDGREHARNVPVFVERSEAVYLDADGGSDLA